MSESVQLRAGPELAGDEMVFNCLSLPQKEHERFVQVNFESQKVAASKSRLMLCRGNPELRRIRPSHKPLSEKSF